MTESIVDRLGRDNDYAWLTAGDGYPALRVMSEADRRQEAADEIKRLRDEVEWLSRALRYISSPTMGLPGGADAAEFCMKGATEQAVRTALRVCIEMARQAMEARRG